MCASRDARRNLRASHIFGASRSFARHAISISPSVGCAARLNGAPNSIATSSSPMPKPTRPAGTCAAEKTTR